MLTDSHSHIYLEYYKDIKKVLEDAKKVGVKKVISNSDSIENAYEIIETAKKYDNYYICLGLFPEYVNESKDEIKKIIEDNLNNKKFVAIGEIGLDYHYNQDTKNEQKELFKFQLDLARKYNKPVVIHSRDATKDTIDILKEYKDLKIELHCFSGSKETMEIYKNLGCYFGIGGVMTFKNAHIKDVIKDIPLDKILLETDSPFLTPTPYRGMKNEPKYIKNIAEFLANLKNITIDEVEKQTEENIHNFFDI